MYDFKGTRHVFADPSLTSTISSQLMLGLLIIAWLCQLWLAWALPWMADEAYYIIWGASLSLGYLDHPPGVALWAQGGRLLNLALMPLMWGLWVDVIHRLEGPQARWIPLAGMYTPLGVAAGVLITPDPPLCLAWAIAVWGYARGWWWLSAIGVALGGWTKPMMWIAATGLGYVWWRWPRRVTEGSVSFEGHPNLAPLFKWALLILTLYSPHLFWSFTHGGLPWTFQGGRRWGQFSLLEASLGQLWVLTPLWAWWGGRLVWRRLIASWRSQRSPVDEARPTSPLFNSRGDHVLTKADHRRLILWWLSAPTLCFWLILSCGVRIEANWMALAWPALLAWILEEINERQRIIGLIVGGMVTAPLALLPLLNIWLPLGVGPPRDGFALKRCLDTIESTALFAGRYQEASLLYLAGEEVQYLRAKGRRLSEFDRHPERLRAPLNIKRDTTVDEPLHSPPMNLPCGALYLGPKSWLGERCAPAQRGQGEALSVCQFEVTRCRCPQVKSD